MASAASQSNPKPALNRNLESLKSEYRNVKHPSAVKLIPMARNADEPEPGMTTLTKDELMEYVNDPFWRNVRRVMLAATVLTFVVFFIAAISLILSQSECLQSIREGSGKNATYRTGD